MVDQIFSYGELGFQEIETNRYLIESSKTNGFSVQEGIAGIPDRVSRDVGIGQAGDRAGFGHRLHSPGVAEAWRGVSRSDD